MATSPLDTEPANRIDVPSRTLRTAPPPTRQEELRRFLFFTVVMAPVLAVLLVSGRNCHGFDYMDFTRQSPRAAQAHSTLLARGDRTCIDCHKGISHRLPSTASAN